jgi:predicted GH43/DUF377 family glycosyl hydrolase
MKTKIISFTLGVIAIYIFITSHAETIIPKTPYNQGVNIIKTIEPIQIAGYKVFNAGILPLEKGYLFVSRRRGDSFLDSLWKKYFLKENIKGLTIGELDKNFKETNQKKTEYRSLENQSGGEVQYIDARLVKVKEDIYMVYCRQKNSPNRLNSFASLYLAKLEKIDNCWSVTRDVPIIFEQGEEFYQKGLVQKGFEKNWMPFVSNDELFFIYLMEPEHVILKADPISGKAVINYRSNNTCLGSLGASRGSTPPVFDEELNEWITLYHYVYPTNRKITNKKVDAYFFEGYTFSKDPPYRVLRKSNGPIIGQSVYNNFHKIIFPTTLLRDGDDYLIFYGDDDVTNKMARISRSDLIKSMKESKQLHE